MMTTLMDYPLVIFALSLLILWISAHIGEFLRHKIRPMSEDERGDYDLVISATLTLLGLLIGFSFSMATSRYDQRKNYEEEEANAIGTEYVRADLLPSANAANLHQLLVKYLDQRILWYTAGRDQQNVNKIDADTAQLQNDLWAEVRTAAVAQPSPVTALAVSGMNDVLNRQGYTQAAWWNRIPRAAWALMILIAIGCNALFGFAAHRSRSFVFFILPLAVSVSFFLIADIDSPRGGLIRLLPQNLVSLSQSLHSQ